MSGASKKELRAALQAVVNAGLTHTYVIRSPAFGDAMRMLQRTAPADRKLTLIPVLVEALKIAGPHLDQHAAEHPDNEFAKAAAVRVWAALSVFEGS